MTKTSKTGWVARGEASSIVVLLSGSLAACSNVFMSDGDGGDVGRAHQHITNLKTDTLSSAAAYAGRHFGSAVAYGPLLGEPAYAGVLAAEFSSVTPENALKWGVLQPTSRDTWSFAQADAIIAAAVANGQTIKGHTLVWHQQLPAWITETMTEGALQSALVSNIQTVVQRYAKQIDSWDVVNEAVADDGSGLRDSIFLRKLGPEYIEFAFAYAHAHDTSAKLYYNDYGIETVNAKSDAVYQLVQSLISEEVPIHGVGMQAHIDASNAPTKEALKANFRRFVELGLTVNLSELDVRVADVPGNRARRLAVQKQVYHRVIAACVETHGCDAVTTWGFTDNHSWIDSSFGPDDPLPFDEQYAKKPAYYAIIDGFVGVPPDDPEAAPNYIANSSFESGTDGWLSWGGSLSASTDHAHTGLRSARVTDRSGTFQGAVHDVRSVVTPGAGYDTVAHARIAGASSDSVKLSAQIICAGEQRFVTLAEEVATDGAWVELAGLLQVPDCQLDALNVYVEGPAQGVDLYVDDFSVREQDAGLGPELIPNTGFEGNSDWWFGWGSALISASTVAAHSGNGSGYVSNRNFNYSGPAINLASWITPGATYQASAWGLLDNASSAELVLTAAATCQGESMQFMRIGNASASNAYWTKVSGSVAVPDCTLTDFFFYVEGPAAGIDFYVDDASFREQSLVESPNILRNSDFETGTDWWFGWGPTSVGLSSTAHGGIRSAVGTGRTSGWNGIATNLLTDTATPVVPGASYAAEGFTRIAGAASSDVYLTLQHRCDGDASDTFTRVATAQATDGDWAPFTGGFSIPECTLTSLTLYVEGAPAGVDILIDDVYVRQQL